MRILLSVPSLATGGAERQFAALAAGLAERGHEVLAVTLGQGGPQASNLGRARLVTLGKASRLDTPRVALALAELLRRQNPQVHYAFLPSCCVLGGLLAPFFPATRLVMGVRATDLRGAAGPGPAGRLLLRLEAGLSRRAALVIANSHTGLEHCLGRGFAPQRLCVVENGIDTELFHPDRNLGAELRRLWCPEENGRPGMLIGLVARLHPMKDHGTFLEAAALLARQRPEVRFVCVGAGPEEYARSLRHKAEALGLADRLTWAGERLDLPALYNALDLLCLSSSCGEGFPNVLGEGLACGLPCVATAAGDSARLLEGIGVVTQVGAPEALAAGLAAGLERLEREGAALGAACRERVVSRYSVQRMVAATQELLDGLLDRNGRVDG